MKQTLSFALTRPFSLRRSSISIQETGTSNVTSQAQAPETKNQGSAKNSFFRSLLKALGTWAV